jgi:hypothetical protein
MITDSMLGRGNTISTKLWDLISGKTLWEGKRGDGESGFPMTPIESVFSEDDKYMAVATMGRSNRSNVTYIFHNVMVLDVSDPTQCEIFEGSPCQSLSAMAVSPLRLVAISGYNNRSSVTPEFKRGGKVIHIETDKFHSTTLSFCGKRRLLAFGTNRTTTEVIGYCWETQSLTFIQSFNFGMKGSAIDGIPSTVRVDYQSRVSLRLKHPPEDANNRCTTMILTSEGRNLGKCTGPGMVHTVIRDDAASSDSILFLTDDRYIWKWNKVAKTPRRFGKLDRNEISMEEVKALAYHSGRVTLMMEDESIFVFSQGTGN